MTTDKKKRVYQVARELNVSNEALIEFLHAHKFTVRNHMAPITDEMYALILQHFHRAEPAETHESDFRKKILEKKREEEARKEAIRHEIDEILEYAKGEMSDIFPDVEEKPEEKVLPPPEPSGEAVVKEVEEAPSQTFQVITLPQAETHKISKETGPTEKTKRHLKRVPPIEKPVEEEKKKVVEEKGRPKKKLREPIRDEEEEELEELPIPSGRKKRKKKKKKKKKAVVQIDEREITASIKETLARMSDTSRRRRYRKETNEEVEEVEEGKVIQTTEFCSVAELANLMHVEPRDVIQACLGLGMLVTINQRLDKDTIVMVADEFGYEVEFLADYGVEKIETEEEEDTSLFVPRPPVVTIMGHVDHGKTSLLDYIRESNIVAGEAGGITQHIGAYEVTFHGKQITFLDTPGHEAFTAMRARGAQVTDIVVLVVAADDSVMPQTVEAINHAKAAGVPIVVAINKIDKPGAHPEKIKKQLAEHNVLVEEWGGKVQCAEVSAKTGQGVAHLLELILLEAELLELKANPHADARGVLIEVKIEKGRGIVGTVLVQKGTLRIGDIFVAGIFFGRVRAMFNERNQPVKEAPPSTPVQVLGFNGAPQAGDPFFVVRSEQEAREISFKRQQLRREQSLRQQKRLTLDQISKRIAEGEVKELTIIIKADVDGSIEALSDALMELSTPEVSVRIIHKGVGAITESDVLLAEASQAVIIGFHVSPTVQARELATREEVDIRLYKIIYDVINDVKLALSGMLEPEVTEEVLGQVDIREVFKASRVGTIAGCYVLSGKVLRNALVRLNRDGKTVYEGKIATLKRFKDDVREVQAGYECGLTLENFNDIKVGDLLEVYQRVEKARVLS